MRRRAGASCGSTTYEMIALAAIKTIAMMHRAVAPVQLLARVSAW
jgi:hypothetical protein